MVLCDLRDDCPKQESYTERIYFGIKARVKLSIQRICGYHFSLSKKLVPVFTFQHVPSTHLHYQMNLLVIDKNYEVAIHLKYALITDTANEFTRNVTSIMS
jgi:hypothetical protein